MAMAPYTMALVLLTSLFLPRMKMPIMMRTPMTTDTMSPVCDISAEYLSDQLLSKLRLMRTMAAMNAASSPAPVMIAATLTANLLKKDAMPIRQPPPIAMHTKARMGLKVASGAPPS